MTKVISNFTILKVRKENEGKYSCSVRVSDTPYISGASGTTTDLYLRVYGEEMYTVKANSYIPCMQVYGSLIQQ